MRTRTISMFLVISLALALPAVGHATRVRRGPTSRHSSHKRSRRRTPPGQKSIDPARATQIQTALVKAGYLQGTPSGRWDNQTIAAMQKLQADNGWQTKITPDARALIKLGLGPSNTGTINPATGNLNTTNSVSANAAGANSTTAALATPLAAGASVAK